MIKKILIALIVAAVALVGYASTKPDTFHVERTVAMKAPPEKIFAQINDFKAWQAWSPYEKLDPAMKKTFSGSATGKGSKYEWDGNSNAGAGSVEITDTVEPSKIVMRLDMIKPFEGHNTVEFTLTPKGDSTDVTWAMTGPANLLSKVMGVVFDCEKMVGGQFDEGLTSLKAITEK